MTEWKIGDEAICVDASPDAASSGWFPGTAPAQGELYTVDGIWLDDRDGLILSFDRLKNFAPGATGGYRASRFRKVQRRDLTAWLATENTIEGPTRETVKEGVK